MPLLRRLKRSIIVLLLTASLIGCGTMHSVRWNDATSHNLNTSGVVSTTSNRYREYSHFDYGDNGGTVRVKPAEDKKNYNDPILVDLSKPENRYRLLWLLALVPFVGGVGGLVMDVLRSISVRLRNRQ